MDKKGFISGIHNYCDRWCERCSFTAKCRVFDQLSQEDMLDPEHVDIEKFWDSISGSLKESIEALHVAAREQGIDLDKIEVDEEKIKRKEEDVKNHPVTQLSLEYMHTTIELMKKWDDQINGSLQTITDLDKAQNILDALEVVHFYTTLIPAKVQRALGSFFDEQDFARNLDLRDSQGTAKITLISVDRSLASWMVLYQQFPFMGDDIISQFSLLEKLKKSLLTLFPNAMKFVRPGLDESHAKR